ncbi:MAG TPA: ubiquinol-cytochrome c reductase cytochrome b subunit [Acidimicrobiales bacterium]|nr:ubiquinol-cytochrome c reductase cytochrome b subunit [Acidimicrobiales bacterium]
MTARLGLRLPGRTKKERKPLGPYGRVGKAVEELDERLGIAKGGKTFLDKIFPDHWSFMLGEIALYTFVILLATGVFLTLYYVPSSALTIYNGPYKPLDGQLVSQAFASTMDLSFTVRAGLLMRQMHHWACDIFVGAIVLHMARVFFTGAFRKPRELNWTIGITMLILSILNGFIGYSLPDDVISGTGIRIAYSILLSIPVVGSYLAFFLFGGNFPGTSIIPRFYVLHVLIIPAVLAGLLGAHLFLLVRQKHTQFPGPGKTERNVVGSPMYPVFMAKTTGFLFMISGVVALLATFFQVNPIWQFGQYRASIISYAVQPDWYMGWLDGALRVMPSWEFVGWGHTIPFNVFLPAIIFPGIIFNICYAWPAIERRYTKDNLLHNLLDRPRDRPKRTAAGAAMLGLLSTLFVASATDVLANFFKISLNTVLVSMRVLTVIVPVIAYFLTYKICKELQAVPGAGKRKVVNVVRMTEDGEYVATPVAPPQELADHELDAEPVPELIEEDAPVGAVAAAAAARGRPGNVGTSSVRTVPR